MAEPFPTNPLFRQASRKIRESARQAYRRSDFGRLLTEFERAHQKPLAGPRDLGRLVRSLERSGGRGLLRELNRSDAGRIARDLERYARRGGLGRKLVEQVLDALGPAGKLIKALSGVMTKHGASSSRKRALESAIELVQSFGHEVLRRPGTETPDEIKRGLAAAKRYLEEHGQPQPAAEPTPERTVPQSFGAATPSRRQTVDVPMSSGITKRFRRDHPIVTGAMVPADSSNVYAYGYDVNSWLLYVRFRAPAKEGAGFGQKSNSPGPLYQYSHVPPELFLSLLRAGSKGNWIWDNLRVRGTVSGHRGGIDYRLVGITQGYVPRKATLYPEGEVFEPRTVRTDQGRGLTSSRPFELVRPLQPVGASTGAPNRGRPKPPNRGGPNRGKP